MTASFVKEAGIDVNRPEAATAAKKDRAILIAISDKGEIWINKPYRRSRSTSEH